jgi:cbb3-type cytochrome oxidase cytochrome c subunit
MPAAEETYRSQRTLHIVFAISSVAMTLSIIWMILADHLRPWKQVQREFHHIEDAKLRAAEKEKLEQQRATNQAQIDALQEKIRAAEIYRDEHASDLRDVEKKIDRLGGAFDYYDTKKRFKKAELDSQRSFYDGMIDRGEVREAKLYLSSTIASSEKELVEISKKFEEADKDLREAKKQREDYLGHIDDLKKDLEQLTREADRIARVIAQKEKQYFGLAAWIRNLPGIDLMPPEKIQQISLPELTINYNFKDVPRYDRCTTCHQGIDRIGYDKDAEGQPMKPTVFAAHPHLTDGASTLDPKGNVVKAGLYLDANGPHPINSFGCTICHGGQGSGTDFTYASHEPNHLKQKEEWEKEHSWHEIHHWDEPMLPKRFMESSCLKCHHQVTDVPQAKKLQAGYERIVKYGCTGCHTIGGEGSFGPDLTDERPVGPNLRHVASKVSKEWILKWIKNPHAFRPDTRMPRFYGLSNNNAPGDQPKTDAEIHAIVEYLFAKSTPPAEFVDPPAQTDPARGKTLFFQKGCLACHSDRSYEPGSIQLADRKSINPAYKPDASLLFDPSGFPESVRDYAKADFGPNLSNVAAKFASKEQGFRWLANWIKAPETYHAKSLMPNLQLSAQDAADIASWIISIPGEWPVQVEVAPLDSESVKKGIDELVKLYVSKSSITVNGKTVSVPLSEVDDFVANKITEKDKLMFLGERTISRLGCFGCHNIAGFENAKPIGTPLNGWGSKSPTKLDYGHILEYLDDQTPEIDGTRDGTDPYYQEKLADHTRSGFLYEKLHRPRSYDYRKTNEDLKTWDDRLRMPQFAFANDPKAVEEVMTFILGLTGEKIASKYLPKTYYTPAQTAVAQGAKLLNRYNCTGCHVLEMPKYTIAANSKFDDVLVSFTSNVNVAYNNRSTDYKELNPKLTYDPKMQPKLDGYKGESITIEGMPIGVFENELTVQLWRPVTIRGFTFNVGDNLTLNKDKVERTDPDGGNFAWLYATTESERTGSDIAPFWNRLPPPLLREGLKVQTPWLTSFLKDPYSIRPAVNLRMPRFHFGKTDDLIGAETAGLANSFAARDGAEFPYQAIPEREQEYLSKQEAAHPNYLAAGWQLMSKGACVQCHAIGQFKPTGGAQVVNGPDLRQVGTRFRPGYLEQWLAKPSRLVPYTAMPQNVPPLGPPPPAVPKGFEDKPLEMVRAMRDTLLNYVNAVEQQLAGGGKPDASTPAATPRAGASE